MYVCLLFFEDHWPMNCELKTKYISFYFLKGNGGTYLLLTMMEKLGLGLPFCQKTTTKLDKIRGNCIQTLDHVQDCGPWQKWKQWSELCSWLGSCTGELFRLWCREVEPSLACLFFSVGQTEVGWSGWTLEFRKPENVKGYIASFQNSYVEDLTSITLAWDCISSRTCKEIIKVKCSCMGNLYPVWLVSL